MNFIIDSNGKVAYPNYLDKREEIQKINRQFCIYSPFGFPKALTPSLTQKEKDSDYIASPSMFLKALAQFKECHEIKSNGVLVVSFSLDERNNRVLTARMTFPHKGWEEKITRIRVNNRGRFTIYRMDGSVERRIAYYYNSLLSKIKVINESTLFDFSD